MSTAKANSRKSNPPFPFSDAMAEENRPKRTIEEALEDCAATGEVEDKELEEGDLMELECSPPVAKKHKTNGSDDESEDNNEDESIDGNEDDENEEDEDEDEDEENKGEENEGEEAADDDSTGSNCYERMDGEAPGMCRYCRRIPCEWTAYAPRAYEYMFEATGGMQSQLPTPFKRCIQAKHRYELYRMMDQIRREYFAPEEDENDGNVQDEEGERVRERFPTCCEYEVRAMFPDPNGNYTGFKSSR